MELPDHIYEQIEPLSAQGNDMMDDGRPAEALQAWRSAYELLPEPRDQWQAALWLHASMADAYYQLGNFSAASTAMREAINAPGGDDNPYVHYMQGKSLLRLQDEKAVDSLLKAYMLDGYDIFDRDEDEGEEALQVLQDRGLLGD